MTEEAAQVTELATEPQADASAGQPAQQDSPQREQKLSRAFAEIARREKMIRQRQQEFESRSGDLELVELLKTNPLAALEKTGKSYDELTKEKLKQLYPDDPNTQFMMLKDELSGLKKLIADKEAKEKEHQEQAWKRAHAHARQEFLSKAKQELSSNPEYSLLRSWPNAEHEILDYIDGIKELTGKEISIQQACAALEDGLDKNFVEKFLQTDKIKSRYKIADDLISPKSQAVPAKVTSAEMKTITNNLQAGAVMPKPRKLTKEEAMRLAVEQLRRR